MKSRLETGHDYPLIILEIDANLTLKGSETKEVTARSDGQDDLLLEQRDDHIYVHSKSDSSITVPLASEVKVEAVLGNGSFRNLEGDLVINRLDGNLSLRNVGPTRVDTVKGNLHVRRVSGDLDLHTINGNASVEEVQGAFTVQDKIGGNLNLQELMGNSRVEASGNLSIHLDPLPGASYEFIAGGNLACWLPEDASVVVNILRANKLNVNLGTHHISERGEIPFSFSFGDGEASLKLSAGGNLVVAGIPGYPGDKGFGVNIDFSTGYIPESLGEDISRQIEAQMEMLERQIEFQIENLASTLGNVGISDETAERISRKAREASVRATARAQEKIQRAQEKVQRKLDAARRRAEQKSRSTRRSEQRQERQTQGSGYASRGDAPPGEPVSNEERLIILQMLEEKKITLQEAEQLLAALEGGAEDKQE
jgi:hypothetical protein